MLSRLPIIGSSVTAKDILKAFILSRRKSIGDEFRRALSAFGQAGYLHLTGSGIAAFFIILDVLKKISIKREVVLPAYTAGSLVVAVIKAGLKPVLCDISLKDFSIDGFALSKVINKDTLAVVCVHMFGIPMQEIICVKNNLPPGTFLIEDCAQAMGSKIGDRRVGTFADIGFFSFNRGKNLPTYSGGCIVVKEGGLAEKVKLNLAASESKYETAERLQLTLKTVAFFLTLKPFLYGLLYPLISCFKDNSPPRDLAVKEITDFQSALGLLQLKNAESCFRKRNQNGIFLLDLLKNGRGIIFPEISKDINPVFNRLPVVFEDLKRKKTVEKKLRKAGIETSEMYRKPLHQMFNLGYKETDFPNANYLARHLLTLPVHPSVRRKDLLRMGEIIKNHDSN